MQTTSLNIRGLQPTEVTPNASAKTESGFEGILNQALPKGESVTGGILGETKLEAGSNGPTALDQELDQASESQISSELAALLASGFAVAPLEAPQDSSSLQNLLAKKDSRTAAPSRTEPSLVGDQAVGNELIELDRAAGDGSSQTAQIPEGFEALETPEIFKGSVEAGRTGAAGDAAQTGNSLSFTKATDPIGQLLNEKWQSWVKQNYVGPLASQSSTAFMPAAMNTAFSAACQTGQISLAQNEVKAAAAAGLHLDAAEGPIEGEPVDTASAGSGLGGAFGALLRTSSKAVDSQMNPQSEDGAAEMEDESAFVIDGDSALSDDPAAATPEQLRIQAKEQVQTQGQTQPLNLDEERAVVKQASKTLQDMIEANRPKTMTIRLNPDDLGSLTIKVRQFGRRVDAEVSASLDSVRQALANQKQDLAAAVENRGSQLTSLIIKSEASATDSHLNNSFSQSQSSGDGRTHQEAQQEANRQAQLAAAHSADSDTQPTRTQLRIGRPSRFDLRA